MRKFTITLLLIFILNGYVKGDKVGLILLRSVGSPCLSSSNSHFIIRDWFEEILIDSLNNKVIFNDSIEVIEFDVVKQNPELVEYYEDMVKASYNLQGRQSNRQIKFRPEIFENIDIRFIGELEIICLSKNNYIILKIIDLEKSTELKYRYLLPINALSGKKEFRKSISYFINKIFFLNNQLDFSMPSFAWDFNLKGIVLQIDNNLEVKTISNYQQMCGINYKWNIYRLQFSNSKNNLISTVKPYILTEKVNRLYYSGLDGDTVIFIDDKIITVEQVAISNNSELDIQTFDLCGPGYYYIIGSKSHPFYNVSLSSGKLIYIGSHRKNVVGIEAESEGGGDNKEIYFGPYYQRNYRIRNIILGLRATYVVDYRKYPNEKDYFFQSLFISSGPVLGFGKFKTFEFEPFIGVGRAQFYKKFSNVITFQLGIRWEYIGLYKRYIYPIDGGRGHYYGGLIITIPTYRLKRQLTFKHNFFLKIN